MILNVNDFGCVPDGRFLERASIDAGSSVLTDSDGTLRPTDVGKNIAIPGAADLVATIAGLVDRGDVKNVVMGGPDMTSKQLKGVLFNPGNPNPVPFRADLHVGRRITVAGAGSGGGTLLTNIASVLSDTLIELEHDFQTPVTGSTAILNREDRIALGNYARRSVENVTVDLGDRTITDAQMIVGGRGLISQIAKFSSLDLDKQVTIKEAGLHVTTIASYQSNTKVNLAVPAQRKVDKQQADVWKTDSRAGFELLLASLENLETETAEIVFGTGVYDFTRSPDPTHQMNAAIKLRNLKNLTIRGAGPGVTILRLMPQQDLERPDTHVIETRDCKRLTFRDFSLHGAYLTMGNTNEQMHGLFLNEGSEEIIVERLRVFQSAGDGLRFLGSPDNKVRKVWVDGCQFVQNKRTGVAFQRGAEFVWIRNCYIEMIPPSTDSCLDFEPSGHGAPTDIIIDANFMKHGLPATAVAISGIGGPEPTRRVKFSNNVLIGGEIFCTDVDQLTIQNNTVLVTDLGIKNRIPVQIQRGGDSVIITGNLLVNDDTATRAVISLTEVNNRQVTRALVANNLCFARTGIGIQCLSGDDIAVQGNIIVATGDCKHAILVRSEASAVDNISIRDNDITVEGSDSKWETGIGIAADPHDIGQVSVIANSIRRAAQGIVFLHRKFTQTPICALNRVSDVAVPLNGIRTLPAANLLVGGAAGWSGTAPQYGTGRFLAGFGDPNVTGVIGSIGDLFQRLDGPPGLYVNEKGNVTKPWIPK
jgi:hypothetical protein